MANLGDPAKRQPLADNVVVTLVTGIKKRAPSVIIRDRGVGLRPKLIPLTILSLSGTGKSDRPSRRFQRPCLRRLRMTVYPL